MTLKIEGLERVVKKIDNIARFRVWANAPMTKTNALLHDALAKYVPKAQGAFSAMATDRQRRAYWAKVRSGAISHGSGGYRRSGNLGRRWTSRVDASADGVKGTVGNNASYARWVQGNPGQQPFHAASGFMTTTKAIEKTERQRVLVWRQAVRELLAG